MRITRAAKVAAFPLIVLALVALVACQGPVGLPGKDGKDGTGTTGDQGERGKPGFPALAPVADADVVHIDADTKGTVTVVLNKYFTGGVGDAADRTYAVVSTAADANETLVDTGITEPTTADISGSDLTLTVTAAPSEFDEVTVVVKATDTAMVSVNNNVVIRRNRAPMVAGDAIADLTIGLQTDEHAAAVTADTDFTCSAFNVCSLTVPVLNGEFTNDAMVDDALDKLKYSATSSAPGIVHAETASDGSIKITGLESADEPVEITVTATDSNLLTAEKKFEVTVNQPPVLSTALPTLRRRIDDMVQPYEVFMIANHFSDPETPDTDVSGGVTYVDESGKSSDPLLATLTHENNGAAGAVGVSVPANAHGIATITLRVAEGARGAGGNAVGIGQWVEASFMVVIS